MAKKAIEDLELDVDEVLLMELIDYASKRGTVPAVQDLVAKALAEAGGTGGMGEFHPRTSCINMFCVVYKVYIPMDLHVFFWIHNINHPPPKKVQERGGVRSQTCTFYVFLPRVPQGKILYTT